MVLIPLLVSGLLLATVLELVRRRRLREELSWLWVAGASTAVGLSAWGGARAWLRTLLGADASGFLLVICLFLAVLLLQLSVRISSLANREKTLAQHVARIEARLDELEREAGRR